MQNTRGLDYFYITIYIDIHMIRNIHLLASLNYFRLRGVKNKLL
jgi:hypothetical protein